MQQGQATAPSQILLQGLKFPGVALAKSRLVTGAQGFCHQPAGARVGAQRPFGVQLPQRGGVTLRQSCRGLGPQAGDTEVGLCSLPGGGILQVIQASPGMGIQQKVGAVLAAQGL